MIFGDCKKKTATIRSYMLVLGSQNLAKKNCSDSEYCLWRALCANDYMLS